MEGLGQSIVEFPAHCHGVHGPSGSAAHPDGIGVARGHPMPRSTKLNGTLDGIFGSETHKSVVAYQLKNGLSADRVAGKNTLSKMDGQVANLLPDTQDCNNRYSSR